MSESGHSLPLRLVPRLARCPEYPESRHDAPAQYLTRMGWTGRAPAPTSSQSTRGLCQEKEHHHASHVGLESWREQPQLFSRGAMMAKRLSNKTLSEIKKLMRVTMLIKRYRRAICVQWKKYGRARPTTC
jgi:hypothetical protein